MKQLRVTKHAMQKLKNHFCWVYQNEILDDTGIENGEVIEICAPNFEFLGVGYYNKKSQITVRILSFEQTETDKEFFEKRILSAWEKRQKLFAKTNAVRIIHSEADFLPGLIVDWYNGYLAIQINTLGMETFRQEIISSLSSIVKPLGIIDKSDRKVRKKEGLETLNGVVSGEIPDEIVITENGIRFSVNLHEGQKTGFYLDQRKNRAVLGKYISENDDVLDIFCNAGGFGLYSLQKNARVTFVDVNDHALKQVAYNIEMNGFKASKIINQDAFEFLTLEVESDRRYECIILDPPPFAKTKKEAAGALKGFKFLFSSGLKLSKENGYVAIFSCSHHIGVNELLDLAYDVASRQKEVLEVVEILRADSDHPYILNIPNTAYLSGIIFRKTHF